MQSPRDRIVKATALLMSLQVFAMLTILLKQVITAAYFGTSETMDAYLLAITVVGLVQVLVSRPIRQTLIPMFRHDLVRHGETQAWATISILLNNVIIVLIGIVALGWFLGPAIVTMIGPGFSGEIRNVAGSLTRLMMASVFFFGMATLLSQLLFSYQKFLLPGLMSGVNNLVIVVLLVAFTSTYGIYGLAAGVVCGAFCQFALQLPILWKNRTLYSATVDLCHPGSIEMAKLSVPVFISAGGKELARFTDRIFASLLPVGSLSALSFAYGLLGFLQTFFIGAAQESTFPHFTNLSAQEKFATLSRQLFRYIRVAFFITVPISVGAIILGERVVRVVYQRGAFDDNSVQLTSSALVFYAVGFPASSMSAILNRTFFGLKDTWTPTKVAMFSLAMKIVLCWMLIGPLSHAGIALADSISQIVSALLLFVLLPAQVKGEEGWNTAKSVAQTLAAAMAMAAVIYLPQQMLKGVLHLPMELFALIFMGAASYGLMTFFIQRKELQSIISTLTGPLRTARASARLVP
jgi:putative peptidoglycan lipid II flippase